MTGASLLLGVDVVASGGGHTPQSTYSLTFDGSNDSVTGPNQAWLDGATKLAISLWFKGSGAGGAEVFTDYSGSTEAHFEVWQASSSAIDVYLYGPSAVAVTRRLSGTYIDGAWHHLGVIYDGSGTLDLYLDGSLANGTLTGSIPASLQTSIHSSICLAAYGAGSAGRWPGQLDDVALLPTLTSGQIASLANGATDPATLDYSGGGLLYRFEEGSGTSASDSSGNGNAGTLNNGPTWSSDVPTQLQ